MKVSIKCAVLLALCVSLPLPADAAKEGAAANVQLMSEAIDQNVAELNLLTEQIELNSSIDVEALRFRKDGRSLDLLIALDALSVEVSTLPQASPERVAAEGLLTRHLDIVGEAIFGRLGVLLNRIVTAMGERDSLSGGAKIAKDVYIQSLQSMRFKYYESLVNHFDSRKILGLSSDSLRDRLSATLYVHAEKLAGQVEYASVSLSGLQAQLDADPDNSDIVAVLTDLNFQRDLVVSNLNQLINLRERLGENSDQYKAVLVKGSSGISVELLSVSVVRSVMRDWGLAMAATVKASAPDIIFKLLLFFSIIIIFRFLSRMTKNVVKRSCDKSSLDVSNLLKDILISGSGGTVMLLGVFMALSQIGISLGPMLAGLGVAGFVIGFALQDTLGNFAAGAMILIYRPYDVDDFVEVTGASGLVKKMNLVSTTITTFDNQTLVVPNSRIWGDVIKNVTAQKLRRVDLEFGIGYGDDIEHTERVLRDIIDSHDLILAEPAALIKLHTLGESSVNFIVRPWAKTEDYWNVYWDIMREVKMRFDREGISIPFPQRDVHVIADTNQQEVSPS
ncbi:MAG: small conductance mechanosensitive channel [Halioglobus sp.]|jgi:small conductance mechanosensitive channel